jgi:hypothetical protein
VNAKESKKEIKADAVVKDLRSGAEPTEIMRKYKLTEKGFRSTLRKLVLAKALRKTEIERFYARYPDLFVGDLRLSSRTGIKFPLVVCAADNPSSKGFVKNISEKGIAIEGFESRIGETKELKILSSEIAECATIVLEAKCMWIEGQEGEDEEPVAGFQITSISKSAMKELKKLI